MSTVIEYIIEQADINDIKNLQFEKDVLFMITREKSWLDSRIISCINDDVKTVLQMQQLLTHIENYYKRFNYNIKTLMSDKYKEYYNKSYEQMENMIQYGKEMQGKLSESIKEITYGSESIKFIRDHALELTSNYTGNQINSIRSSIGDMLLRGTASKVNVRNMVQKILDVNKSKAEEIAQTELSRAYNYGTLARLYEYKDKNQDANVKKYWYGFKTSATTCEYCRERIGNVYNLEDDEESLPAHVRCRCTWLPILDGWDTPISTSLISRANMLNTAYSKDMIYNRIASKLDINYSDYIDIDAATNYMVGDRSEKTILAVQSGRNSYINDLIKKFDIVLDTSNTYMSSEFNSQMKFWERYVSGAVADNDRESVGKAYDAIKAVTILPWNANQLSKWNSLLNSINLYR